MKRLFRIIVTNALLFSGALGIIGFDLIRTIDPSVDWNGFRGVSAILFLFGAVIKIVYLEHKYELITEQMSRLQNDIQELKGPKP